jgi:hypothetical protein
LFLEDFLGFPEDFNNLEQLNPLLSQDAIAAEGRDQEQEGEVT